MQRHLGGDVLERLHLVVRGTHPRLDGAERMLNGLAPQLHGAWIGVQSRLRSLDDILALPPPNAALLARRAIALERAIAAFVRPVNVEHTAVLFTRHSARQLLASGADVAIILADPLPAAKRSGTRRLGLVEPDGS